MIGTKTSEINELGKLLIKHASFWESEASRRRRHASFPGPVIQLLPRKDRIVSTTGQVATTLSIHRKTHTEHSIFSFERYYLGKRNRENSSCLPLIISLELFREKQRGSRLRGFHWREKRRDLLLPMLRETEDMTSPHNKTAGSTPRRECIARSWRMVLALDACTPGPSGMQCCRGAVLFFF